MRLRPDEQDGYIGAKWNGEKGQDRRVQNAGRVQGETGVERQGEAAEGPSALGTQRAADKDPQEELGTNHMVKQHMTDQTVSPDPDLCV